MNHRGHIPYQLGVWIGVFVFFGCVTGPSVRKAPPLQVMSSGAYETSHGRAFYGIGKAEGSRNATLLRATAVNLARKELADVLDRYVVELFQATQTISALTVADGEQMIGGLVRDAMKLSVISYQWNDLGNDPGSDPENGRLYALCRLDLDRFKQVLATQTAIAPDVRAAMAGEAENVHAMMVQP
jgi:hypothetical protein